MLLLITVLKLLLFEIHAAILLFSDQARTLYFYLFSIESINFCSLVIIRVAFFCFHETSKYFQLIFKLILHEKKTDYFYRPI